MAESKLTPREPFLDFCYRPSVAGVLIFFGHTYRFTTIPQLQSWLGDGQYWPLYR